MGILPMIGRSPMSDARLRRATGKMPVPRGGGGPVPARFALQPPPLAGMMRNQMNVFRQLDGVLRGEGTRAESLRGGRLGVSGRAMLLAVVMLGSFYGACMGCFNVVSGRPEVGLQILSSAIKVPLLFLLTLAVTFPSLYVFNALVGGRLTATNMLRLILAAVGVMLAVLAGFGTIVAFFNFTTDSYPFVLLLNVVVFAAAGVLGLSFMLQTLRRLVEVPADGLPRVSRHFRRQGHAPGALTPVQVGPTATPVKIVFRIWVVVFALVGAQMSWVLRPFVGNFDQTGFVWLRPRGEGNFFGRVVEVVGTLLGAGG